MVAVSRLKGDCLKSIARVTAKKGDYIREKNPVGVIIPPQNGSFSGGIYCFQPVRPSVIPPFRQHFKVLMNNFCVILIEFAPHINH